MLKSMTRRKARQLGFDLRYRGRGGYRPGAGRPKKPGAGVPHVRRPALAARHPVHVTARVCAEAAQLRSRACFRVVASCIGEGCQRDGFRLVHFSVQSNHLHLIVEARDAIALARGIQGLSIRIAKAVNRALDRRGKVFAAGKCDDPCETRRTIHRLRCRGSAHLVRPPAVGRAAAYLASANRVDAWSPSRIVRKTLRVRRASL